MAAKMTADADTRVITVTEAPVGGFQTLSVVDDIYEPLKDDWHSTASLQKLKFPFRSFGDPKSATSQIGPYVFFGNAAGWRFLPYDSDHQLELDGNLVGEAAVQGLTLPIFLPRTGRTIIVPFETSAQALTNQTGVSGLTATEAAQWLEMYRRFGLDKDVPVVVEQGRITIGSMAITMTGDGMTSVTQQRE